MGVKRFNSGEEVKTAVKDYMEKIWMEDFMTLAYQSASIWTAIMSKIVYKLLDIIM